MNFFQIYQAYEKPIFNYILRMVQDRTDAEDLTQEVFIKVYHQRSTFRGESNLSTCRVLNLFSGVQKCIFALLFSKIPFRTSGMIVPVIQNFFMKRSEFVEAAFMAHPSDSLFFDLANPLSGTRIDAPDFF